MSYPVLSRADAKSFLQEHDQDSESTPQSVRVRNGGSEQDWDQVAATLKAKLDTLTAEVGDVTKGDASKQFEARASVLVHKAIPPHPALADPGFWTWLTVTHFRGLVAWRYPDSANPMNFGLGSPVENLVFRLWLRGEIACDPEESDPYRLARVGDIDFWRSHIFRQGYTNGRRFARALISYQFPAGEDGKPRLRIGEIRELVKRLKNARSNLFVEVMDEEHATRFIESERQKLEAFG